MLCWIPGQRRPLLETLPYSWGPTADLTQSLDFDPNRQDKESPKCKSGARRGWTEAGDILASDQAGSDHFWRENQPPPDSKMGT